jgi:hypothetical protein
MHSGFNAVTCQCRASQRGAYSAGGGQQERLAAIELETILRDRHFISPLLIV